MSPKHDPEENTQQLTSAQIFSFAQAVRKQREAEERLVEILFGPEAVVAWREETHPR